ncbi:MAG: hypothetical protein ACYDDV_02660 [Methanoregula sp.]
MPNCPFCSSDEVYDHLFTWRCKRCKNIGKEGEGPDRSGWRWRWNPSGSMESPCWNGSLTT